MRILFHCFIRKKNANSLFLVRNSNTIALQSDCACVHLHATAQGQGGEEVMDTRGWIFRAASGLGAQEPKEQCCTYLMKILDFE